MLAFRGLCIALTYAVLLVLKLTQAELDEQQSPVVQTESGAVVGKIEILPQGKSVHEYLGIPYAEPPVGGLRFAPPKRVKPWSGIKNATEYGASCPQSLISTTGTSLEGSEQTSEDCLFLNVFVPATVQPDDKMAVMVWIYGGSFNTGSSSEYPSGVLAAFNDVIVVSINYRLGVLGFLNVPGTDVKGNYGMLDQILTLKWVQSNIARFGGDPNRVTIFGESSGAFCISLHLISPLSKGLFHRAIMQSGASSSPLFCGKVNNPRQLELFSKAINCTMGPHLVGCVRGKSVEDILLAQNGLTIPSYMGSQDIVGPIVDGHFLPDLPEILYTKGQFQGDVDIMTGFNSDEGSLSLMTMPLEQLLFGLEQTTFEFAVRNQMIYAREKSTLVEDLILFQYTDQADPDNKITIRKMAMESYGDTMFVAPILLEAKALAKAGRQPYVYLFDHRPEFSPLPDWFGVVHGSEIPFVFGEPFKSIVSSYIQTFVATNYSETEKDLSSYVMKLWTAFAKYGSPNPANSSSSAVMWPKFTEQEQEYLVLDVEPKVESRFRAENMAFWNEIVPKLLNVTGKSTENKQNRANDEM